MSVMTEQNLEEPVKTLFTVNTDFNADSVEWCPFPQFADLLVCGTYHLQEEENSTKDTQTRNGNITLYQLQISDESEAKLDNKYVFTSGGVLDMKWCRELLNEAATLGVACSNGKLLLLKLIAENENCCLAPLTSLDIWTEVKKMVLSLDWVNERPSSVVISDTCGNLNYLSMKESELVSENSWNAHSFEAWIVSCDYSQPHVLYSGGDDCIFKGWDVRDLSSAIFVNKRHSMGVTAISKSRKNENLLVTGSYDETVRLWDTRSMKVSLSDISLGGGIWRLKWHPEDSNCLLSASMHNGFHVLSIKNNQLELKDHYSKHESLAYGVDWCYMSEELASQRLGSKKHCTQSVVASCSFYDKLMHIWKASM